MKLFKNKIKTLKKAIGILPVTMATPLNTTYYTPRNPTYAIEDDGNSVITIGGRYGDTAVNMGVWWTLMEVDGS